MGQLSTNHRSEQQAATQAMSHLIQQTNHSNTNIVFLIYCKSTLRSVQNEFQDNATRNVKHQFSIISRTNNAALQLIPAFCGITGNESSLQLIPAHCGITGNESALQLIPAHCGITGNKSALQLIPALCGITGNESADKLAKQASEC